MSTGPRPIWCRHHSSPTPMTHACAIGVDIKAMVPPGTFGGHYMLPCHTSTSLGVHKRECAKRSLFTAAEVEKQDAETDAAMQEAIRRLELTVPMIRRIKEKHRRTGRRGGDGEVRTGVEPCPVCGNSMDWSLAGSNGHIAMKCQTPDCIAFME